MPLAQPVRLDPPLTADQAQPRQRQAADQMHHGVAYGKPRLTNAEEADCFNREG